MVESGQRTIKIKQLGGAELRLIVNPDISISELKGMIQRSNGMAPATQRLIYAAKPLVDAGKLSDYITEDNQAIHLVQNPGGAASAGPGPGAQPPNPMGDMMNNMMRQMGGGAGGQNPLEMLQNLQKSMGGAAGPGAGAPNPMAMMQQMMQGGGMPGMPQAAAPRQAQAAPAQTLAPIRQAATPVQQPAASASAAANTLKLPNKNLIAVAQICNRMMGPNAAFPGVGMPPLPYESNNIVQLGSYMSNMSAALQRLLPFMSRCGDLMQRESQITDMNQRMKLAEMVVTLGCAIEEIAKSAGSTAHLYQNLELGPNVGQFRMKEDECEPCFAELVKEAGTGSAQAATTSASTTKAKAPEQKPEEVKTEATAEDSTDKRLLAMIGEEFQQMEMLTIIMGNFQQINGFQERIQKVLRSGIPDQGRDQNARRALVAKAVQACKDHVKLPEEMKDSIYEQFDPALILSEIFESKAQSAFDQIIDFDGDNCCFIGKVKEVSGEIIVKIISEIEEGFVDGVEGVLPFIKANIENMLMISAPPAQANMAKGIAIPTFMRFVQRVWNDKEPAQADAPKVVAAPAKTAPVPVAQPAPVATPKPAAVEENTVSLNDQLATAKNAAERKQMLLARYREQVQKDQAIMQQAGRTANRPLSRAYASLDLNANNTLVDSEEQQSRQVYQKNVSEKALSHGEFFKSKMRLSILDTGLYKSGVVDANMKDIDAALLPEELKQAYFNMIKAGIKSRLVNDNDFKEIHDKTPGRFEFLERL